MPCSPHLPMILLNLKGDRKLFKTSNADWQIALMSISNRQCELSMAVRYYATFSIQARLRWRQSDRSTN